MNTPRRRVVRTAPARVQFVPVTTAPAVSYVPTIATQQIVSVAAPTVVQETVVRRGWPWFGRRSVQVVRTYTMAPAAMAAAPVTATPQVTSPAVPQIEASTGWMQVSGPDWNGSGWRTAGWR